MSHTKGWIGVDLDGTLAEYTSWRGIEHIGAPVPSMRQRILKWLANGEDVRIFTARVGPHCTAEELAKVRSIIEEWLMKHIGRELPVTATKDLFMSQLWDDRCVQVIPNTGLRVDGQLD